ncbi:MAG: dienelactone hydrolase family protein [Pseudomonadota bacterium]
MHKQEIVYQHDECRMKGYVAYDEQTKEKRPAVLVVHDWSGRNEFACQKAEKFAEMGYVGFAVDMYGDAQLGTTNEEKMALIEPLMGNRALLQARMLAALKQVKQNALVDVTRISVIGFCFGGLCALDLARTGENIVGAVSFHGLLEKPQEMQTKKINSKILVLHGYDDPMVVPEQVNQFAQEMTTARADWQIHMYGNTKHAFTNPVADDDKLGVKYNAIADKRSWQAMQNFFNEIFA